MTSPFRFLVAAAAVLLAVPALAQYGQPGQYPPPQPPQPPQPQPGQYPPPAYQPPPPGQPAAPQVAMAPVPPPQKFQLAATLGWQINGDVDVGAGKLAIADAQSFGLSVQMALRPGTRAELLWLTSNTHAEIQSYTITYPSSRPFNVAVNYFQLGATHSLRRGAFEPFGGATLGAAWYNPDKIESTIGQSYYASDTWRFAFTVGAGANLFFTPALALRLHARMLVPVYFAGGGFYVGTGGSGATVSAGIPAAAADFGIGLAFAH